MAYLHIRNLYQDQSILMFKECYALEKIHGTSAHIRYKDDKVTFFAGGCKHDDFIKLFNEEVLMQEFRDHFPLDSNIYVYGEAYGGKLMGMKDTYGDQLKFIVFETKIGDRWLNVPRAEIIAHYLGQEFVYYRKISTDIDAINAERDAPSIQAVRNGIPDCQPMFREGIVLHPLEELTKNNGERIICKHKRAEFSETKTSRNITDKFEKLIEVNKIIDEWLTEARLNHIINGEEIELKIENISKVIVLMKEDIYREAKSEIKESKELEKAIGRETALMFKRRLNSVLK